MDSKVISLAFSILALETSNGFINFVLSKSFVGMISVFFKYIMNSYGGYLMYNQFSVIQPHL